MLNTNNVYYMFGYDELNGPRIRRSSEIYNTSVPIGNQCTVESHFNYVRWANQKINGSESFRCDYHIGDTADFMAMCNEMHINCDNQCSLDRHNNEFFMEHHRESFHLKPDLIDVIFKNIFGWDPTCYPLRELPRKTKYFIICNGNYEEHHEYLGLNDDDIKLVEQYKSNWWIK